MQKPLRKNRMAFIAIILAIQFGQFEIVEGQFGLSKIVGTISSGVSDVAKASVGAVVSVPQIIAKPFIPSTSEKIPETTQPQFDTEGISTYSPDLIESTTNSDVIEIETDTSKPDSIVLADNDKAQSPSTTPASGSRIPSLIKKPIDIVAGIPNTVVTGAGDAWRTVSETVVNQDPAHSVKFYLYDDPENLTSFKQIVVGQVDTLRSVNIPKDSGLNILIHGFMQDINSTFLQETKDTILLHNGDPVVCVDWGHMADGKFGPEIARTVLYPFIVDNVAVVGDYVGEFLVFLKNNSAIDSFDQIHIMGFSLGAHVSGIAGWTVQNRTDGEKIARITGLDPAGPKFFLKTKERRLNHDDAKFVDVIHTSHLGYFLQMGHVDFFPNGGKLQPGCVETDTGVTDTVTSLGSLLTGSCSHARAWQYYMRSIRDNELYGCECNNIFKYELTGCEVECEDKVPFGDLTPGSARGNYFLTI